MTTAIPIRIHVLPDAMKMEKYIRLNVEPTISLTEIQDKIVKEKAYSFPVENPTPLHARAIELLHDGIVLDNTNLRDHLAEGATLQAQFNAELYQQAENIDRTLSMPFRLFASQSKELNAEKT